MTTGHEKYRFTVAIITCAAGNLLKSYVIFKGLKNVPKCHVPSNIILSVSKSGSMKEELMLDYCRRVLRARGLFLCKEESLLLLDTHASHTHAKTTSYLQPLDVSVNGPFKAAMRYKWNKWYETGPQEFTPKGIGRGHHMNKFFRWFLMG